MPASAAASVPPVVILIREPLAMLVTAKDVVVAFASRVLPRSVVEERRLAKVELNWEEMVVEPVTARADEVAPAVTVRPEGKVYEPAPKVPPVVVMTPVPES